MEDRPRPSRFNPRTCAFCGEAFRTESPSRKYCTPMCRAKAEEARWAEQKRPAPPQEEG